MNLADTLETVLKANVVHIAATNQFVRQLLAQEIDKDEAKAKQIIMQVEQSIQQDLQNAEAQLPAFLQHLDVPADLKAGLRDLHLSTVYSAIKTDATQIVKNLEAHFVPQEVQPTTLQAVPDLPQETPQTPPVPPTPPEAPAQ